MLAFLTIRFTFISKNACCIEAYFSTNVAYFCVNCSLFSIYQFINFTKEFFSSFFIYSNGFSVDSMETLFQKDFYICLGLNEKGNVHLEGSGSSRYYFYFIPTDIPPSFRIIRNFQFEFLTPVKLSFVSLRQMEKVSLPA